MKVGKRFTLLWAVVLIGIALLFQLVQQGTPVRLKDTDLARVGKGIAAVSEVFTPDGREYYRESHAKIYRAALSLYARGEPVDAITLVDELEERSELENAGGRIRIHELAALVRQLTGAGILREP